MESRCYLIIWEYLLKMYLKFEQYFCSSQLHRDNIGFRIENILLQQVIENIFRKCPVHFVVPLYISIYNVLFGIPFRAVVSPYSDFNYFIYPNICFTSYRSL